VSEQAAGAALQKLADSPGDAAARDKVGRWLLGHETVAARIDASDLDDLIVRAAAKLAMSESYPAVILAELKINV
jgi:hypothetical protein